MKILYVEDDQEQRTLGKEMLQLDGHTVDTAENPGQATEMYQENPYDLVITDYLFNGDSTGLDLAEQLDAEVMIYSGYNREFIERDFQGEKPEFGFMQKGSGWGEIREIISEEK